MIRANSNHARRLAPPPWVAEVVADVRAFYNVPSKRLLILWRKGSERLSSGHTKVRSGEIVITAGYDEFDQGEILLHELAHWLCRPGIAHKVAFWCVYWRLVRHFRLDERVCLEQTAKYSKKAEIAYRRGAQS